MATSIVPEALHVTVIALAAAPAGSTHGQSVKVKVPLKFFDELKVVHCKPSKALAPAAVVVGEVTVGLVGTVSPITGTLHEIFPGPELIPDEEVKSQVKGGPPFVSIGIR